MKRSIWLLLFCLFFSHHTTAQTPTPQTTIDQQVWRPFIAAYAGFDTEAFMALHTNDVIRVVRDGERILTDTAYYNSVARNHDWGRNNRASRSIDFRFTERFAQGDYAFETGYYKIVSRRPGAEPRIFYGHFHVVLQREDGRWKIALDIDTSHDGSVQASDFESGLPLGGR